MLLGAARLCLQTLCLQMLLFILSIWGMWLPSFSLRTKAEAESECGIASDSVLSVPVIFKLNIYKMTRPHERDHSSLLQPTEECVSEQACLIY